MYMLLGDALTLILDYDADCVAARFRCNPNCPRFLAALACVDENVEQSVTHRCLSSPNPRQIRLDIQIDAQSLLHGRDRIGRAQFSGERFEGCRYPVHQQLRLNSPHLVIQPGSAAAHKHEVER